MTYQNASSPGWVCKLFSPPLLTTWTWTRMRSLSQTSTVFFTPSNSGFSYLKGFASCAIFPSRKEMHSDDRNVCLQDTSGQANCFGDCLDLPERCKLMRFGQAMPAFRRERASRIGLEISRTEHQCRVGRR